jgi:hypothetical protein
VPVLRPRVAVYDAHAELREKPAWVMRLIDRNHAGPSRSVLESCDRSINYLAR